MVQNYKHKEIFQKRNLNVQVNALYFSIGCLSAMKDNYETHHNTT